MVRVQDLAHLDLCLYPEVVRMLLPLLIVLFYFENAFACRSPSGEYPSGPPIGLFMAVFALFCLSCGIKFAFRKRIRESNNRKVVLYRRMSRVVHVIVGISVVASYILEPILLTAKRASLDCGASSSHAVWAVLCVSSGILLLTACSSLWMGLRVLKT